MAKGLRCRLLLAAALVSSACTVSKSEAPPLTGPSELALSVRVTATPDSLSLDGGSQSAVVVEARDVNGAPRPGLPIRLDIMVGQTAQDCGQLSARNVVTGSDGRAFSVFTAPAMPLPLPDCAGFSPGSTVTITATPSGTNFQTAVQQAASIRMVPTGVILPPAGTPKAAFTVSPTTLAANLPIRFDASTSIPGSGASQITSYTWSFGDGQAGTGQSISHVFTTPATYNVTLTVMNDRDVTASTTQALTVAAGAMPTVDFQFSPSLPFLNQLVFFDATQSRPGVGHTIVSYRWNFGDGTTKSGVTTTHDFTATGTYNVILTVTDEAGQSTSVTKAVAVASSTAATPVAVFTYSPPSPVRVGTPVVFDATGSTAATGATIITYSWSFGDGSETVVTAAPANSHSYGVAGTFTITLTIQDSLGKIATTTRTITVQQ